MQCQAALFTNCADISVSTDPETSPNSPLHPGAVRGGCCGAGGMRAQAFWASHSLCSIRQMLLYGGWSSPFLQPVPGPQSAHPTPSSMAELGAQGGCCGYFCLWTWEQGRCQLQFRHKNSQHLLQSGWAGPGWDPCQPWLARQRGLVRISLPLTGGAAWPWGGA